MNGLFEFTLAGAFLVGLTGGGHCAAMCGALVGLACGPHAGGLSRAQRVSRALAYNAGRIATYTAAGALTGALGAAGLALRGTPVTQQGLLVAMSLALIVLAGYIAGFAPLVRAVEAAGGVVWRRIQPYSRGFLPVNTPLRAFGLGLLWGWLPCGMVYAGLLAALASADPLHGALVMAAFGLGTLPNLLALSVWFESLARLLRRRLARALVAAAFAGVGILGIVKSTHAAVVCSGALSCLGVPAAAWPAGGG